MTYTIKDGCIICGDCQPQCPKDAIRTNTTGEGYWIDPTRCDRCPDVAVPPCLESCTVAALAPLKPKKGRTKSSLLPAVILEIFLNGKTNPFASSIVVWEACNILAQRHDLIWEQDIEGKLNYRRPVRRDRGELRFRLAADPEATTPAPLAKEAGEDAIANFDVRAACLHLIFSAYATTRSCPWEESFVINDQQIEKYLGLEKRKDLTKLEKLRLIKRLIHQSCQLLVAFDWPRQGRIPGFVVEEHFVWKLENTQYYFEENGSGHRHLIGLAFTVRAGRWAKSFLNIRDYRRQKAFYQYGTLPQSLLTIAMGNWQRHEGAVRLLLWLIFKLRLGGDQRIKVQTLLKVAYGEKRLSEAIAVRGAHKSLLKTFEGDLEAIYSYGLKPCFDPDTYPTDIQPLWARVGAIPDGADDAVEFWIEDANRDMSLTDLAPRDKWQRLLHARLLGFELSKEWQQSIQQRTANSKRQRARAARPSKDSDRNASAAIKAARQRLKLSQRSLAGRLGKSQSWIRDIEKGRFNASTEDLAQLLQILEIA